MFKALLLEKSDTFTARVASVDDANLPPGGVLVQIAHSSLNDRDGLAITDRGPVARRWLRRSAWTRLATDLPTEKIEAITRDIPLDAAIDTAGALMQGRLRGRVVVSI